MASLATAKVSNAYVVASGDLLTWHPIFRICSQSKMFLGPVVTLKVFEDNVLVRELLETRGEGRVLVIDGGGSLRCALGLGFTSPEIEQEKGRGKAHPYLHCGHTDLRRRTDLVLKPTCGGCGAAADLYGSNCKHMTFCSTCGKAMAESGAKCYECGATLTHLIRICQWFAELLEEEERGD
ncbi:hypothetical protein EUGRSUZ_A01650 [Eucalyptus grandis]|uniref:Uncharacterized protein n=2 Tax=Eucalyptus grandis TaxID=71139 RepID=A0ACC3M415_EUCGR|nr:hypothetical protein EUGRSUZ_A01650 [Eucalyptus grandis]